MSVNSNGYIHLGGDIRNIYILLLLTFGFGQDYSLQFDGDDDYVSTGIPYTDLYEAEEITISVSINWSSEDEDIAGVPSEQAILANLNSGNSQLSLMVDVDVTDGDKKLCLTWADVSTIDSNGMERSIFDYEKINFNEWYNIRVVLSDNHVYWYLNDLLLETDDVIFTTLGRESPNVPDLNIGRGNTDNNYDTYFNGLIDSLSISINDGNIIGNWNFNEGSGTTVIDHTGNGNDGIINGGATYSTDVPIIGCTDPYSLNYDETANVDDGSCEYPDNGDYSLSFDGVNDYIKINKPILNANEFSLIFSIKTGVNNKQLFWNGKLTNTGSPLHHAFNFDLNTPNDFYTGFFSGNDSESLWSYVSLTDNILHQVVVTFENGTVKHFVDGLLTASDNFNFNSINVDNNNFTTIGRGINTSGFRYYDGLIQEILIINKSLDESELSNHLFILNYSIDISAHYKFNTGEGIILYDHSGNGNHGNIHGATWAGCTDPLAENYLSNAEVDDGSCSYPTPITMEWEFLSRANLISYFGIPEDSTLQNVLGPLGNSAQSIIGEGSAAALSDGLWIGSLQKISPTNGYWLILNVEEPVNPPIPYSVEALPTDPYIIYNLHEGQNLISYVGDDNTGISEALPDDIEEHIQGISTSGVATMQLDDGSWVGSLQNWNVLKGYWVNVDVDGDLSTPDTLTFSFE